MKSGVLGSRNRDRNITSGRLGATMGYPGIVLDERGNEIQGFVFSSEKLSGHWAELDEFEGEAYERVLTKVTLKDNTTVDAYIYELREKISCRTQRIVCRIAAINRPSRHGLATRLIQELKTKTWTIRLLLKLYPSYNEKPESAFKGGRCPNHISA